MKTNLFFLMFLSLHAGCASNTETAWYMLPQSDRVESQNATLKEVNKLGPIDFRFSGNLDSYVDSINLYLKDRADSNVRVEVDDSLVESFAPSKTIKEEQEQVSLSFVRENPQIAFGQSAAVFNHQSMYVDGRVMFVPNELLGLYSNANRKIKSGMLKSEDAKTEISAGSVVSLFNLLIPDESLVIRSDLTDSRALARLENLNLEAEFIYSSNLLEIIKAICREAQISAVMKSPNTLAFVD